MNLSKLEFSKRKLNLGFLVLSLASILIISHYTSQTNAKTSQGTGTPSYRLTGVVKTNDHATGSASVKILEDNNVIYENGSLDGGSFSTRITGNKRYDIKIDKAGYESASAECYLSQDTEMIFELSKIPVEATSPAPATTPLSTAPPEPKPPAKPAPSARPKTATRTPSSTSAPAVNTIPARTDLSTPGILDQINLTRKAHGLGSVSLNSSLSSAAYAKAKHMSDNNYFAHTAPDGTTDWYFIDQSGYSYSSAGVNLAKGSFGSATAVVEAWMNSSGHRANILASFGRNFGVGIYGKYIVMVIAS